ncbi:hypothetical protein SNEBB_002303 [Seison nebaliae]|nr:hypothetical protein SNEBB_002303 [Seison nebaliae]
MILLLFIFLIEHGSTTNGTTAHLSQLNNLYPWTTTTKIPDGKPSMIADCKTLNDYTNMELTYRLLRSSSESSFANKTLNIPQKLNRSYRPYHATVSLVVCILGLVLNTLNIIVLSKKEMRNPTNTLLNGLAVSDLVTICTFLIYTTHQRQIVNNDFLTFLKSYNFLWVLFLTFFYEQLSIWTHTLSIWLTVILGLYRYLFIKHSNGIGGKIYRIPIIIITIIASAIITILVCIPSFFLYRIVYIECRKDDNSVLQFYTGRHTKNHSKYSSINLYNQALIAKIIPSVLLILISSILIRVLSKAHKNHLKIMGRNTHGKVLNRKSDISYCKEANGNQDERILLTKTNDDVNIINNGDKSNTQFYQKPKTQIRALRFFKKKYKSSSPSDEHQKTTALLTVVCAFFIIVELPQGIILMAALIERYIYKQKNIFLYVYLPLGPIFDVMALVNNAINFLIYCCMSTKFRKEFKILFIDTPVNLILRR